MGTSYHPQDAVVVVGHGVGRVVSANADQFVVRLSEGEVTIKVADADRLLRAVVEGDEARRLLTRLCEPCREERSLPEVRSIRELARAPLERQVEYARWYFRKRKALHAKEVDIVLAVSETVIAELAVALGVNEGDLRSAAKRGKPDVEPRLARVLPKAPALEGYTFLRSFWLGAVALVGETPEQDEDTLRVSVRPGAWHAYSADDCEAPFDDGGGVLLRHSDFSPGTRPASAKLDLGGVNLEGGTISVLDAAALTDPDFGVDEVERTRRDGNGYGDRGIEAVTHGDGDHRVMVDDELAAMLIALPF